MRILVALLTVALVATLAATAFGRTTVTDPKRETEALERQGRLDIVRATAGRDRVRGQQVHSVTMRRPIRPGRQREQPVILINTRGGGTTDPEYAVFGEMLLRVKRGGDLVAIGRAQLRAEGRTWTYRFDPKRIPDLRRYGWAALLRTDGTSDVAPEDGYAKART